MERIEKLKAFLANNPDDAFLKHALALEYIKAGDDPSAQTMFEEILTRDPSYVGSYYHLGKLYERNGDAAAAMTCYEKGMKEAQRNNDQHALNELRMAYEDIAE
jgi:Tfp pilus assembly protein PilF